MFAFIKRIQFASPLRIMVIAFWLDAAPNQQNTTSSDYHGPNQRVEEFGATTLVDIRQLCVRMIIKQQMRTHRRVRQRARMTL